MSLAEDDGKGERAEGNCSEDETGEVEPVPDRVGTLGQHEGGAQQSQGPEEHVEPEDRPPRPSVDQKTSDQRTEGETQARDGRPYAERTGSGCPVWIELADHRQGAGFGRRCPHSHHHPTGDEDVTVGGDRAHDRTGDEDGYACEHHLLSPEQVAGGTEAQHEAGEGEGIAVDHPLQLSHRGVELALDVS